MTSFYWKNFKSQIFEIQQTSDPDDLLTSLDEEHWTSIFLLMQRPTSTSSSLKFDLLYSRTKINTNTIIIIFHSSVNTLPHHLKQ